MNTIIRKDIVQAAAKGTGVSLSVTGAVFDAILEEIRTQYRKGNRIEIRGFGTFYPKTSADREYNIPRLNGARIATGRTALKFRQSKQLTIFSYEGENG